MLSTAPPIKIPKLNSTSRVARSVISANLCPRTLSMAASISLRRFCSAAERCSVSFAIAASGSNAVMPSTANLLRNELSAVTIRTSPDPAGKWRDSHPDHRIPKRGPLGVERRLLRNCTFEQLLRRGELLRECQAPDPMCIEESDKPLFVTLDLGLNLDLAQVNRCPEPPQLLHGLVQRVASFDQTLPVPLNQLHDARLGDCDRRTDLFCKVQDRLHRS